MKLFFLEVKCMKRYFVAQIALGLLVITGGLLGFLHEAGVLLIDWRLAGPLLIIGFGVWLLLCCVSYSSMDYRRPGNS